MIGPSYAEDVAESIFIIMWSLVLRARRICMVESSHAGDVATESFFHNYMVLGSEVTSYLLGCVTWF